MFPRLREQIGTALDLIVEFSTLGEYRLGVTPAGPGAPGAPVDLPGLAPQMGGRGGSESAGIAGVTIDPAARTAVRRIVAGGAAGETPVATPAALRRQASSRRERRQASAHGPVARPAGRSGRAVAPEQLCLAV